MKEVVAYDVEFIRSFSIQEMRKLWRWRIVATNGRKICGATEGFVNKSDCVYNAKCTAWSIVNAVEDVSEH